MAGTSALSQETRDHLVKVYSTLALGCALAALGVLVYLKTGIPYLLPFVGSLGAVLLLQWTPREYFERRAGLFALLCFSQGAGMGGLIDVALAVDPSLVVAALATTICLFAGFSFAALRSEKRSYLYLGALLYSALGWLSIAALANLLFRSQIIFNLQLYGGLLLFSGYIVFDTQLIVEKHESGDDDVISHAVDLFLDVIALFVRILIIMLKDSENKSRRRRNNR